MSKGNELDKQIYEEGEPTWGMKDGWLDVEDVKEFIKKLKEDINNPSGWVNCSVNNINRIIDKRAGDKLTGEKEND